MGTHPIFESDFDCLTEINVIGMGSFLSTDGNNPGLDRLSTVLSLWREGSDPLVDPPEMIWWIGLWDRVEKRDGEERRRYLKFVAVFYNLPAPGSHPWQRCFSVR